jgi:chemotaxis protein methyltransferase CheR
MAGTESIDHEFSFSRADFDRVRQLIYRHAGISLHEGKHAMVYSRLSRRLRDTGHRSFANYLQWLESTTGAEAEQEWQEFV